MPMDLGTVLICPKNYSMEAINIEQGVAQKGGGQEAKIFEYANYIDRRRRNR